MEDGCAVHAGIDGCTRLRVYACCSDNRAATVLPLFEDAVHRFGLPSRVQCDKGGKTLMLLCICWNDEDVIVHLNNSTGHLSIINLYIWPFYIV